MSTVVGVMDRDGWDQNTDVLAVVDPSRRRVLSVPRDLWCDSLRDRVNAAFAKGGHAALAAALADHGIHVRHGLVLNRPATEHALEGVEVTVPVPEPLRFRFQLTPTAAIEDGEKVIRFDPPEERLSGDRIHEWLTARYQVEGAGSDLYRIARQQTFVRALLEQGFDFTQVLADPEHVRVTGPGAIDELRTVDATWRFTTLGRMRPVMRDGKAVLLRRSLRRPWG